MDYLSPETLRELLETVGDYLHADGESASIVVVGGATLSIVGWTERTTADVDVIARAREEEGELVLIPPDPLPEPLTRAIERTARDYGVSKDWMNTVVGAQWSTGLPPSIQEELRWEDFGPLRVGFAGRRTLVALKLLAAVDQGPESVHYRDLLTLEPSEDELSEARQWAKDQDTGAHHDSFVDSVIDHAQRDLGRGG